MARDAKVGVPLNEDGSLRAFIYVGARSICQPDVNVIYEIRDQEIVVRTAEFKDAQTTFAGLA